MFKVRWDMRLTDQRMVAFLSRLSEPMSQGDIAAALGCHPQTVYNSIKRLKGIVTPIGKGRGAPYSYIIHPEELPDHLKAEIASNP